MITNLNLVFFSLILFISCRQDTLTGEKKKKIISEIKLMMNNYYDDIKASGLLTEFKYLDSSKDFSWTPPGFSASISFDSVSDIIKSNAPGFRLIKNRWNSLEINPLTETRAEYSGVIASTVTDTSGKTINSILFEKGNVIKRKDGWKLLNGKTIILSQKDTLLH